MKKLGVLTALLLAIPFSAMAQAPADDYTVKLRILKRDGTPVTGEDCRIAHFDPEERRFRVVTSHTLSDDGVISVTGLEADTPYIVWLGRTRENIGTIRLESGERMQTMELVLPPAQGDVAPDVELAALFGDEKKKLSDFRGQLVLLDFWASWCSPCQAPMQENQEIMTRRADEWEGKATIVALSIDDSPEDAIKHVEAKGWTAIDHYFSSEDGLAWQSKAVKVYGVTGIPTVFLIDPAGTILWRGNPNQEEMEALMLGILEKLGGGGK